MLKRLNIKGFILVIVSVSLAVISVFCWCKYHDCLTSYEKEQAYQEIQKLTKDYNEAIESYAWKKAIFDYYGMQISTLEDDKEVLANYERQINEQKSILAYFNKKASTNKAFSVICISSSAVLLIAGIVVTVKSKKSLNDSICEESIIEEKTSGGEENV